MLLSLKAWFLHQLMWKYSVIIAVSELENKVVGHVEHLQEISFGRGNGLKLTGLMMFFLYYCILKTDN